MKAARHPRASRLRGRVLTLATLIATAATPRDAASHKPAPASHKPNPASHQPDPAALLAAAREALGRGDFDGAERLAQEALALDDTLAPAWRVAGLAAFRAGRFEDAERAFAAERSRAPDTAARAVAAFNLAGAAFKRGRFAAAEADYLDAAIDPALAPLSTLNAGMAAESDGRSARALDLYRAAAKLASASGAPTVAEEANQRLAAADQTAADRHRDQAFRLGRAGSAALKAHHLAEAVTALARALDEADAGALAAAERADLDYAYGHALLEAGRTAEAVFSFRRALLGAPRDPEFRYMLATALDKSGDEPAAATQFQAALDAGLDPRDAARARAWLDARADRRRARPPRFIVETQLSFGYDSHYLSGREAPFMKSGRRAGTAVGAPEILAGIEPRLRLLGTAQNGLSAGNRLNALLYASADADPFSLIENALYLEGTYTPRDFVTLSAVAEGYLETAGIASFGLYQTGAQLALRAVFLEGDLFATRLRYAATWVRALQEAPPNDYRYMTGFHHEAAAAQSFYPGRARFSLSYTLTLDDVGTQAATALDVLGDERDAMLRRVWSPAGLIEPLYLIPYSYLGSTVAFEGEGDGEGGGVHLGFGVRYEHRDYFHEVRIAPDPARGYHRRRADDRLGFELSVRRELWRGLFARASLYLLFSRSTINNDDPKTPYDFDDKNYSRFVGTLDLLKNF